MNEKYPAPMMVLQSLISTKKPQKSLLYVTISFFTRAVLWTFCFPCMLVRTRRHARRALSLEATPILDRPSSASSADDIDVERVGGRQVYRDDEEGGNDSDSGVERDGALYSQGLPEPSQDSWTAKLQSAVSRVPWQFKSVPAPTNSRKRTLRVQAEGWPDLDASRHQAMSHRAGEVRKVDESVEMEESELLSVVPHPVGPHRLLDQRRGRSPDTVGMNSFVQHGRPHCVEMLDQQQQEQLTRLEQQLNHPERQEEHLPSTLVPTPLTTLPLRPQRCSKRQGSKIEFTSTGPPPPTSSLHEKRSFFADAGDEVICLPPSHGYHHTTPTEVEPPQFFPQPGHFPLLIQHHDLAGVPLEPREPRGNERENFRRSSLAMLGPANETMAIRNCSAGRNFLARKQMRSFHRERRAPSSPAALTPGLNGVGEFFDVDEGDNGMDSTLLAGPTSPLRPITLSAGPLIDTEIDMERGPHPGPSSGFSGGYTGGEYESWVSDIPITGEEAQERENNALLDDNLNSRMDDFYGDKEARDREERERQEWESQERERQERKLQEERERQEKEEKERQEIERQQRERQERERREKVHKCKTCGKEYPRRCELTKHEKCHIKPFHCTEEHCNKSFSLEKDLKRHKNSVHRMGNRLMCPVTGCLYAEEGIARSDNLRRHMETVHGGRIGVHAGGRGSEESTPGSEASPGSEWSDISSGVAVTAPTGNVPRYYM